MKGSDSSIKIMMFGIARDLTGSRSVELPIEEGNSTKVSDIKKHLSERYPGLNDLNSIAIAVNRQYAKDTVEVNVRDEVALIPPVSGG